MSIRQDNTEQLQKFTDTLHDHMQLYGYIPVRTPIVENAEIFLTRAGDKLIDKLLTFAQRGQQLTLRPEFTASAAAKYVQENLSEIVRWQFRGDVFEDIPDQYAHDYQRYNIGAELIGWSGSEAEAEVISMAAQGLLKTGFTDWKLVIGHSGLQAHLLNQFGLDKRTTRLLLSQREALAHPETAEETHRKLYDALQLDNNTSPGNVSASNSETEKMLDVLLDSTRYGTTMGGRSRRDIAERLLHKQERSLERENIDAAILFLQKWCQIESDPDVAFPQISDLIAEDDIYGLQLLADWELTVELLEAYNVHPERIIIQPDLARNWEYYTGIVFGIRTTDRTYIAAGGRYDELTRLLGGSRAVPAVGMAYYVDRILPVLAVNQTGERRIFQLNHNGLPEQAAMWATCLRDRNIPLTLSSTASLNPVRKLTMTDTGDLILDDTTYPIEEIDSLVEELQALI